MVLICLLYFVKVHLQFLFVLIGLIKVRFTVLVKNGHHTRGFIKTIVALLYHVLQMPFMVQRTILMSTIYVTVFQSSVYG